MAVNYSAVNVDPVAAVGLTEKRISGETNPGSNGVSLDPNQAIVLSCTVSLHPNDSVTVTLYRSAEEGTILNWFPVKSFVIVAGDGAEKEIFSGIGGGPFDVGYVASGSTDTPTVTTVCKRGPVNAA